MVPPVAPLAGAAVARWMRRAKSSLIFGFLIADSIPIIVPYFWLATDAAGPDLWLGIRIVGGLPVTSPTARELRGTSEVPARRHRRCRLLASGRSPTDQSTPLIAKSKMSKLRKRAPPARLR